MTLTGSFCFSVFGAILTLFAAAAVLANIRGKCLLMSNGRGRLSVSVCASERASEQTTRTNASKKMLLLDSRQRNLLLSLRKFVV